MDKGVWIIAEQWNGKLKKVSFELLSRARRLADKLGDPLSAVLLGYQVEEAAQELIYHGADVVYLVDHPKLFQFDPDPYVSCLERLIREERPKIIVAAATTTGRTLMPILAARLHTGLTADCTDLDIEGKTGLLLQTRPPSSVTSWPRSKRRITDHKWPRCVHVLASPLPGILPAPAR